MPSLRAFLRALPFSGSSVIAPSSPPRRPPQTRSGRTAGGQRPALGRGDNCFGRVATSCDHSNLDGDGPTGLDELEQVAELELGERKDLPLEIQQRFAHKDLDLRDRGDVGFVSLLGYLCLDRHRATSAATRSTRFSWRRQTAVWVVRPMMAIWRVETDSEQQRPSISS